MSLTISPSCYVLASFLTALIIHRRKHIPEAFQGLMVEEDSEIIDFYPEEFHIDMNGKKMLWQGVALLPFIDQERLLAALAKRYSKLSEDEVRRNTSGKEVIFVNEDNPFYNQICSLYMKRKVDEVSGQSVQRSRLWLMQSFAMRYSPCPSTRASAGASEGRSCPTRTACPTPPI